MQRRRDLRPAAHKDERGAEDIHSGHQRNDERAHARNAVRPAEQHHAGEQDRQTARDDSRPGHGVPAGRHGDAALQRVEKALDRRRDAVDLRHCAHAEQADRRPDDRERHGEPAPAQPLLDVAEWPAEPFPALPPAVAHRKIALGILRSHAEQRRDHHPQQRARPARGQRRGHADDIARADRGGKGRAQRGIGRDAVRALPAAEDRAQCLPEPPQRQAAQAEHVPDARPQKQCHHRPAPHGLAHARQKRILHNFSPDSEQSVNFGRAVCLFLGRPV